MWIIFWLKNFVSIIVIVNFASLKQNNNYNNSLKPGTMSNERKSTLRNVMSLAWQFVKRNGLSLSEALTIAWRNIKLRAAMSNRIVRFYYRKVDGTIREAYGTLAERLTPATTGTSTRRTNDTVQTYFDTEKQEWRCFKKANLYALN